MKEQSRGTTSGSTPTADVGNDAVGVGSTLYEGMASDAKTGMADRITGRETLGTT